MSEVYVCHTIYHLYITCIKILVSGKKPDLVLCDTIPNYKIIQKKIIESNLFKKVMILEHSKIFCKMTKNSFHLTYICILMNIKKINLQLGHILSYENIYLYTDYSNIGAYLIIKKKMYHLIEDGFNMFRQFDVYRLHGKQLLIKKVLYRLFKIPYCIGISNYAMDIEVNDKNGLKTNVNAPLIQKSREELIKELDVSEINCIRSIFGMEMSSREGYKKLLLITQPLIEIGIVKNEEEQIEFYRASLKEYIEEHDIYIKPHPRDCANYFSILDNKPVTILDKNSPIEILDFDKDIRFDLAITYSSTSIYSLKCCDKIKILNAS